MCEKYCCDHRSVSPLAVLLWILLVMGFCNRKNVEHSSLSYLSPPFFSLWCVNLSASKSEKKSQEICGTLHFFGWHHFSCTSIYSNEIDGDIKESTKMFLTKTNLMAFLNFHTSYYSRINPIHRLNKNIKWFCNWMKNLLILFPSDSSLSHEIWNCKFYECN